MGMWKAADLLIVLAGVYVGSKVECEANATANAKSMWQVKAQLELMVCATSGLS